MQVEQKRRITANQVARGSTFIVRGSRPSPSMGPATQRFFTEGEQHEAHNWEDTVLPPDDEPEEPDPSGSFDKVPRQKSSMVALALLVIGLSAGIAWGVQALLRGGRVIEASATQFAAPSVPVSPSPVPSPVELPNAAEVTATEVETKEVETTTDETAAAPGNTEFPQAGAAAARQTPRPRAKAPRRSRSSTPSAQQLVTTPDPLPPASDESLPKARESEPGLEASLESASNPFSNGELIPPRNSGDLIPPRLVAPGIAPATTGAAAPEKSPPSPDEIPNVADPTPAAGRKVTDRSSDVPDPFQPGEAR